MKRKRDKDSRLKIYAPNYVSIFEDILSKMGIVKKVTKRPAVNNWAVLCVNLGADYDADCQKLVEHGLISFCTDEKPNLLITSASLKEFLERRACYEAVSTKEAWYHPARSLEVAFSESPPKKQKTEHVTPVVLANPADPVERSPVYRHTQTFGLFSAPNNMIKLDENKIVALANNIIKTLHQNAGTPETQRFGITQHVCESQLRANWNTYAYLTSYWSAEALSEVICAMLIAKPHYKEINQQLLEEVTLNFDAYLLTTLDLNQTGACK